MESPYQMEFDDPDDLWDLFCEGNRSAMAAQRCSKCGGALQWSPYISPSPREFLGKMEYPMGLSIYCLGACNHMLAHFDGRAPQWALGITDWNRFNVELKSDYGEN